MTKPKSIIIATEGTTTNLLFETLTSITEVQTVIIESPISKTVLIKNRIKRIGLLKVIGQIMFMALVIPILKIKSKVRISEIISRYKLSNSSIPVKKITQIKSVNNQEIISLVNVHKPDYIFINGTRIIGKNILDQLAIKPINIHVGITPKYRGVHGGYWALYNGDHHLFGTTLHFVDSGIDSGTVIDQKTIVPGEKDQFLTYPILQYCEGLEMLKNNIRLSFQATEKKPLSHENTLYFHPTIFQYIYKRLVSKIK
ncbi:MAG: formyl transferase [Putridiphycobacter sp.]|nr:formyl transferase [Putridiphycobacter sp.]